MTPASDGSLQISSVVSDQLASWSSQWEKGSPYGNYSKFVEGNRQKALAEPFDKQFWASRIHPRSVVKATKSTRGNSSSDQMSTQMLACLPTFILKEFSVLFLFILESVALPTASFEAFLFLLHKKLGGFRTIGMFHLCTEFSWF